MSFITEAESRAAERYKGYLLVRRGNRPRSDLTVVARLDDGMILGTFGDRDGAKTWADGKPLEVL